MNKLNEAIALVAVVLLLGCASETASTAPDEDRQAPAFDNAVDTGNAAASKPAQSPAAVDNHPVDTGSAAVSKPAPSAPTAPVPGAAAPKVAMPATATSPENTNAEYCAGHGPPASIRLPSAPAASASTDCDNGIASQIFRHGFCSCGSATFSGGLAIDALDSGSSGRPVSASVGVNDRFSLSGIADIAGSLIVAGRGGWSASTIGFNVDGNLETNSPVSFSGININVGRDLWVNGPVSVSGSASVDGDIYQTPGNRMSGGMTIGGKLVQRDFEIAKPCACDANEVLDIVAIVKAAVAQNQNAAATAQPSAPMQILGRETRELDCGRIAYGPTQIAGVTTLKVPGRTALFIDGNLAIAGGFEIDVGTSGELDVFVSGNMSFSGLGIIGSRERPAAVRFYVGGSDGLSLSGAQVFAANLYAPRAHMSVAGGLELWGSVFVGSFSAAGAAIMHYDSAVLRSGGAGETCNTPPTPPGEAPPGRCEVDLDCPSPLVCVAGGCMPLTIEPE